MSTTVERFEPAHLERWHPGSGASAWDDASNYSGADLSEFYLAPIHKTRDTADALTLSNWRVIAAELDKLKQHDETGETTIGHWACGWYAIYLIHETDTEALRVADQWAAILADYPIADESDCSELEFENECEAWDAYGRRHWQDSVSRCLDQYAPPDADAYWADDLLDSVDDTAWDNLWRKISDKLGWHCEHHSDGPLFNINDAIEQLTAADLSALTGVSILAPDQQWRREPYPWPGAAPAPLEP